MSVTNSWLVRASEITLPRADNILVAPTPLPSSPAATSDALAFRLGQIFLHFEQDALALAQLHGGAHHGEHDPQVAVGAGPQDGPQLDLEHRLIFQAVPHAPEAEDPIAGKLNHLPKYVASRTLDNVSWSGSSLLGRDVAADVAKLKEQPGQELQVHGSGDLAHTLIENDLVDEYRLLYVPVHLGSGKRLFRDGGKAGALKLVDSVTTSTGVLIATYVPDGPVRYGSYALED